MKNPICGKCQTDAYLHILEYQPVRTVRDDRPTLQSAGRGSRVEQAYCRYLCAKCGSSAGHSVPETWAEIPSADSATLAQLSAEQNFFFDRYGQKNEQITDSRGRTIVQKHL